jgi:tetratricopeptide (TPR) repeat protein
MDLSKFYYSPASAPMVPTGDGSTSPNPITPCMAHNFAIDSKIYFRLGSAELALGRFDDAIRDFQTALALQQMQHGPGGNVIKDVAIGRKIQEAMKGKEARRRKEEKSYSQMFGAGK